MAQIVNYYEIAIRLLDAGAPVAVRWAADQGESILENRNDMAFVRLFAQFLLARDRNTVTEKPVQAEPLVLTLEQG